MFVQLCEYTKNHQIAHFRRVNFLICELYLNKDAIKSRLRNQNGKKIDLTTWEVKDLLHQKHDKLYKLERFTTHTILHAIEDATDCTINLYTTKKAKTPNMGNLMEEPH